MAIHAARHGAKVAISARSDAALREMSSLYPDNLFPYPLDATDGDATERGVAAIEADLGPIDIAVLNAGTHRETPVDGFKASDISDLLALNVVGHAHGLEALLPRMTGRRAGRIALVGSVAGYRGLPRAAGYCASKAGVIAMAEALKPELDPMGVSIQVVNPGFVRTPLTDRNDFPMPFLMEPEDAAKRIWRGLHRDAFEIAFPKRFVWQLKILQILPAPLYFWAVKRFTGIGRDG